MSDRLEFDVVIVGGGPAGLSAALRLAQLPQARGGAPLSVAVLEKARELGGHSLSGAILDPSALHDLVPDAATRGAPLECPVRRDDLYFLTARHRLRSPLTPPPLSNHGNFVISLNRFVKWLGGQVEAAGVDVFAGFAVSEMLYDGTRVVGVRTGDRGLDKRGQPKAMFEPGVEIRAKVTIVCDGVRGNLTKTLVRKFALDGTLPQTYAIGLKELWSVPADRVAAGSVTHTIGHPLRLEEFGGGFIYAMPDNVLSVGFVTGLDYKDPLFDPHVAFQRFKQHPFVSSLLRGGTLVRYGAKALPEGGWHAIPTLYTDGALIAGDAGGLVNSLRLKGIHLAMRSGMLAAEAAFDAVRAGDASAAKLASYQAAVDASAIKRELFPVRNVHQAFEHGLLPGLAFAAWSLVSGGSWLRDPMPARAGHERMEKVSNDYDGRAAPPTPAPVVKIDRQLTFDRATGVHYSGTRHREDEPSHLIVHDTDICRTRCVVEYANPCLRFCPANVYEMADDGRGGKRLQTNASNCVHCKSCDVMDPYQIIDWVPPEGGEGPQYDGM